MSLIKKQKLGTPLFLSDFQAIKEALHILQPLLKESPLLIVTALALVLLLLLSVFKVPSLDLFSRKGARWATGTTGFVVLAVVLLANNPVHSYFFKKQFLLLNSDSELSMSQHGMVISYLLQKTQGTLHMPLGYTDQRAEDLAQKFNTDSIEKPEPGVNPDVIIVMSESLFDPLELSGIKWRKDPLAFTRSMAVNRPLSLAVVPTFGGKTANSEFEFLTGHSIRFFPEGTIPYKNLNSKEALSIVKTFKDNGYSTTAIHPFVPDFWNRENVYKSFGFDRFISLAQFGDSKKFGKFVTDASLLEVFKKSLEESQSPNFYFLVTIQNHMPYDLNVFDMSNLLFEPEGLTDSEKVVLNSYSKMLEATDHFHRELIESLKNRSQPTILIIFGDHLPTLMNDFGAYNGRMITTNKAKQWSTEETKRMFTTPLVIWSNFEYPDETEPLEISFLAPRLMQHTGLKMHYYQNFLADLSQQVRVVNPHLPLPENHTQKELIYDYSVLQYRLLKNSIQ